MVRQLLLGLSAALVCLSASNIRAEVNVGDKPAMAFQSANGMGAVSLEKLKGKIVVVDFWATWCGPCMAEADHMVRLNQQYAPKGIQLIGISLDNDKQAMVTVAAQKGFAWPQACDGQGWQNAFATQFGVRSIPATYIISPEGAVLWKGHPAQLDAPLADALANHPPQLVEPKVMEAALAALDKAEGAMKENAGAKAVKALASLPAAAKVDAKISERLSALEKQVDAYATKALDEIDPMIAGKQYAEAASKLGDLAQGLGKSASGEKARKKLAELMANPEVKTAFETARRNKAADDELAIAKQLQADKKNELAYLKFKSVAVNYPGTPAAEQSKSAIADFEKDPNLVKKANEAAVADKANAALGLANNYKKAGRVDLAKKKYGEIVAAYPNTSFAKLAQEALAELAN